MVNIFVCWGYLIEERVDEFVIEIYIEVSISIHIVYADPDLHSSSVTLGNDRQYVDTYIAKDITKKMTLVCNSSCRLQETSIKVYL